MSIFSPILSLKPLAALSPREKKPPGVILGLGVGFSFSRKPEEVFKSIFLLVMPIVVKAISQKSGLGNN